MPPPRPLCQRPASPAVVPLEQEREVPARSPSKHQWLAVEVVRVVQVVLVQVVPVTIWTVLLADRAEAAVVDVATLWPGMRAQQVVWAVGAQAVAERMLL